MAQPGIKKYSVNQRLNGSVVQKTSASSDEGVQVKVNIDQILSQILNLSLTSDTVLQQQLAALKETLTSALTDEESARYAVDSLHKICMKDRSASEKVVIALNTVLNPKENCFNANVRKELLKCAEDDFNRSKDLLNSNPNQFLNAVAFLGELFRYLRTGEGLPLQVLTYPLIEYFNILLNGDEAEVELFAYMMTTLGMYLENSISDELSKTLIKVRATLMTRNLSSNCRLWLLYSMDLSNCKFSNLPAALRRFYSENLGESFNNLSNPRNLFPIESNSSSPTKAEKDGNFSSPAPAPTSPIKNGSSITERMASTAISKREVPKHKSNRNDNYRPENPSDRPDRIKQDNFRDAFGISARGNKTSSAFCHDDRHMKNYDESAEGEDRHRIKHLITKPQASSSNWRQPEKQTKSPPKENNVKKPEPAAHFNSSKPASNTQLKTPTPVPAPSTEEEVWDC